MLICGDLFKSRPTVSVMVLSFLVQSCRYYHFRLLSTFLLNSKTFPSHIHEHRITHNVTHGLVESDRFRNAEQEFERDVFRIGVFSMMSLDSGKWNQIQAPSRYLWGPPRLNTRPLVIYVNDLPKASQFQTRLFADDTNLTFSHKNITKLNCIVNTELNHIDDWMKINKLSINYTKTKFMLITRNIIHHQFHLNMGSHSIERIHQSTYLGLILHDKLLWKCHIQIQCSKIAKGCWVLLKIRKYVDLSTIKTV